MRWALLFLTACNAGGATGTVGDSGATLTACPPAPLRIDGKPACNFPSPPNCVYDPPVNVGTPAENPCDGYYCACCPHPYPSDLCTYADQQFSCGQLLPGCSDKVPVCPAGTSDGAACTENTNGECLVLGTGADLSQGIVNGQACACDKPGPIWRCVPASTTKPQ